MLAISGYVYIPVFIRVHVLGVTHWTTNLVYTYRYIFLYVDVCVFFGGLLTADVNSLCNEGEMHPV